MLDELAIVDSVPGHVHMINITCQPKAVDDQGMWKGSIFYDNDVIPVVSVSADTLRDLLVKIEQEIFEDMPEDGDDTPPDSVA